MNRIEQPLAALVDEDCREGAGRRLLVGSDGGRLAVDHRDAVADHPHARSLAGEHDLGRRGEQRAEILGQRCAAFGALAGFLVDVDGVLRPQRGQRVGVV